MKANDALIINKLTKTPFNQRSSSMKFKIDKGIHLSSTKWFNFGSIENNDVKLADEYTKACLSKLVSI